MVDCFDVIHHFASIDRRPGGAFAQAQQQTATQQPATPSQQAQPDIALIPVDLESPIEKAEKDGTTLRISLEGI